jgi:hypothetical protein
VRTALKNRSLFEDMDQFFNPGPYHRVSNRAAPHNMYLDIAKLRVAAVSKRGYEATATITGLTFAPPSAAASATLTSIVVPFSTANIVTWKYDAVSGTYLRSVGGKSQTDAVSRKQIAARNVVVLWAQTTHYAAAGSHSQVLDIQLIGSGIASVFCNGQRFDGTWQATQTSPPVLRDAAGKVISLAPGNTWFQVLPTAQAITAK